MDDPVIQYIIIRNDMDSMTPGRACAQAAHAANHCVKTLESRDDMRDLREWETQTPSGFGTTIVLQANWHMMNLIRDALSMNETFPYDIVEDPEYHVQDGEVTHLLPVATCMWIFGRKSQIESYVSHLDLY